MKRLDLPGVAQHMVQRDNDRQACFFHDTDYVRYLHDLREAALRQGCQLHAYVLMTNHVHLLVTPAAEGAVSRMMQTVGGRYVRYVNDTSGRSGTLWEDRYKSSLVDNESYVLACYRYIELNPVRAGMATTPAEYRWSSHASNGSGAHDPLVTPHRVYCDLADDPAKRREHYREVISQSIPEKEVAAIRLYIQRQRALESDRFQSQVERVLQRRAGIEKPGRPRARLVL